MRALIVVGILGCHHRSGPVAAVAPPSQCLPVRVVDEVGAPVAHATVYAEAEAWVGPSGAFYVEGGSPLIERGAIGQTDAAGEACVEDAAAKLDAQRANLTHASSSAVPYAGGFGPTRIGHTRAQWIYAVADGWPKTAVVRPLGGQAVLRVGPRRGADGVVHSDCDPATIWADAHAPGGSGGRAVVTRDGGDRMRLTFSGLGPYFYAIDVRSCEGGRTVTLDRAASDHFEISTGTPTAAAPLGQITQAATLREGGCVVTDQHELACFAQLYPRADLSPPRMIPHWIGTRAGVAKVATGSAAACALGTDGGVACWGYSSAGLLGTTGSGTFASPSPIALPAPATDLAVGGNHACARLQTGATMCWGGNDYGQLGVGYRDESNPTPIEVPAFRDAKALALGGMHACAVTAAGQVACAGWNHHGAVGDGPTESNSYVPAPVVLAKLHDIVRLAADDHSTHAWDSSGRHFGWGQFGGVIEPRRPQQVADEPVLVRGATHVCEVTGGSLACRLLAGKLMAVAAGP